MTGRKVSPGKEIPQVRPCIRSMRKGWIRRPALPRCPPGEIRQARRAPVSHLLVNHTLVFQSGGCGADYEGESISSIHLSYPFLASHDVYMFALEPWSVCRCGKESGVGC